MRSGPTARGADRRVDTRAGDGAPTLTGNDPLPPLRIERRDPMSTAGVESSPRRLRPQLLPEVLIEIWLGHELTDEPDKARRLG